jgi:enoyl-[acyl-carrier protein] reductase II
MLLGRARAKRGMFEGDLIEGELEVGQIAGLIRQIKPAAEIVSEMITEYNQAKQNIVSFLRNRTAVYYCGFFMVY